MDGGRFGNSIEDNQKIFDDNGLLKRTKLRAGGGPTKRVAKRTAKFNEYTANPTPIAMCDWSDWLGSDSQGRDRLDEQSNRLIGGAKAPGTIKTYNRCFQKWVEFRSLQDKPAIITPAEDKLSAETDVVRFATLHHGPLQKTAATVELYLRALGYMHRLHTGLNPLSDMFRVKLLLQGARREEGPPNRKLPVSCEDLLEIQKGLSSGSVNEHIIFCVILLGWFYMLRKSEYLGPGMSGASPGTFRRSVRVMDLEAFEDSKRVPWGNPCDSVALHIHGSKTDWLNRGTVRTHGALAPDHPNRSICIVHNLMKLHYLLPMRFTSDTQLPFARLTNNALISDRTVALVIKRAAAANGLNPDLYSLHSLRAGGATALFRATGDLDLVGRFGRWKGRSIHSYLWESHVMLTGIAALMTQKDEPLVHLAAGGIKRPFNERPMNGFSANTKLVGGA